MALSENVKGLFKRQTFIEPTLAQSDKELYMRFTAMCSKEKPVTRPMIIEKPKSFYDEMITDKCTFSGAITKNSCKNFCRYKYCLIIQNI
jgi:hypothetical protein